MGRGDAGRAVAYLLAVAVMIIWGVSFTATRAAVREIPPLSLAFLRFALASVILGLLVRQRHGDVRTARQDRWACFLLGFSGVTVAFVFENWGLRYTTASHAALIVSITPLATAAAESMIRRRLPSARSLAGLVAALAGVALVVGVGKSGTGSTVGDLLILATVGSWVAYTFLVRRLAGRYPVLVVTQRGILWGTLCLAPLAGVELAVTGLGPPSAGTVLAVAYLGVFCSALAYLWWNHAIRVLGVTVTNSFIYGIPLVGVLAGVMLLGEPLGWGVVVGGALLVLGVAGQAERPAAG